MSDRATGARTRAAVKRPAAHVQTPRPAAASALVDRAVRSDGAPLDARTRVEMEERLGHDFRDVQIVTGPTADAAARALQAEAFTSGRRIVFSAGRYAPATTSGRRLLAHELAHTVQQGPAATEPLAFRAVRDPIEASHPLEREADMAADRVAAGLPVPRGLVTVGAPAALGRIARQPLEAPPPVEVPDSPEGVEVVADEVERLLLWDPDDIFARVRRRLERLAPGTRTAVVGRLASRVPAPAQATLARLAAELAPVQAEAVAPEPEAAIETPEAAVAPAEAAAEPAEAAIEPAEGVVAPEPALLPDPTGGQAPAGTPPAETEGEAAEEDPSAVAVPAVEGEAVEPEPATGPEEVDAPAGGAVERPAGAPPTIPEAAGPADATVNFEPVDELEAEAAEVVEPDEEPSTDEPAPDQIAADEGAAPPEADAEVEPAEAVDAPGGDEGAEIAEPSESDVPSGEPPAPEEEPDLSEDEPAEEPEEQEVVEEPESLEDKQEVDPVSVGGGEAEVAGAEEGADLEAADVEPDPAGGESPADEAGDEEATSAEDDSAELPAGGGDGGGVPIEDPEEPEAPDVSAQDPAQALATVASLPPAQALAAVGGASAAASRSVGDKRQALAADPPQIERPSGGPTAEEQAAEAAEATAAARGGRTRLERVPEPVAAAPTPLAPLPAPPASPTDRVRTPDLTGGPQGELSESDQSALLSSIRKLPVHDPGLDVTAGEAPRVKLEADADPQRAKEQRAELDGATRETQQEGTRDVAKPMGEAELFPTVPPEKLTATIGGVAAPAAAGPASPATSAVPGGGAPAAGVDPLASVVAQEERGDELRAAGAQAQGDVVARRAEQEQTAAAEHEKADADVKQLVTDNATKQADERRAARTGVREQRTAWREGQQTLTTDARTKADAAMLDGAGKVARERVDADTKAEGHIDTGDRQAATARTDAEQKAGRERKKGEEKKSSGGFLGWLARKAKAFFDGIKNAIKAAFDAARAAIKTAIETAKRLAMEVIDRARKAIVAAIKAVGDALVAIGDVLLAGFPELRDRFRKAIKDRVDKAIATVNRLADELKQAVVKALDLLGAALDAALGLLEKGLLAVVDAYAAVITGALEFANSVIQAFAAFAALIKDVAANPIQWIKNLGASAVDGVKNHLWKAFKKAIRRWFNDKLEEVLGLGLTIWNVFKKGGISIAKIGAMAWEGIKAAIPPTLIQILIEKLIALIIPAAGAILAIIEGLRAAWGTVQRVLEAFEKFFRFLKAVKTGRAGPPFADAVAAAAIVVIDFVANWLLMRLRKPAGALAKRFRAIAKKLGARLGKLAKKLGKKLKPKRRKTPKGAKPKSKKPKPDKRAKAQKRVDAATAFLARAFARRVPYAFVRLQMGYAKLRHQVRLRFKDREDTASIAVEANPRRALPLIKDFKGTEKQRLEYRKRAEAALKFILEGHDIHHILPNAASFQVHWTALDIDWNHPDLTLELPPMLHQKGVHKKFRVLDLVGLKGASKLSAEQLEKTWNQVWRIRYEQMLRDEGHNWAHHVKLAGAASAVKRKLRMKVNAHIDVMIKAFSTVLKVNLNDFRVGRGGAKYRNKYGNKLKAHVANINRKTDLRKFRREVDKFVTGKFKKLSKRTLRSWVKYLKKGGT